MTRKTLLAPISYHSSCRAVYLVLWLLLPAIVRVCCARSSSSLGPDLVFEPPKKTQEKGSSSGATAAAAAAAAVDTPKEAQEGEQGANTSGDASATTTAAVGVDPPEKAEQKGGIISGGATARTAAVVGLPEVSSIQGIDIPFVQQPEDWRLPGHGISLDAKGEPKSGTTWIGRILPQLVLELCGSWNNLWCQMGGLLVIPNYPAPKYEFEMMNKSLDESGNATLFLHFEGGDKHLIPGMDKDKEYDGCHSGGIKHINFFEEHPPCKSGEPPTRERLVGCLWNTSSTCLQHMVSVDPWVRRTVVIVRDPRNVIMSERKMRIEYYKMAWVSEMSIDAFVRQRFEVLVSWTHQRYMWHTTTVMNASSHVVVYEDIQETHMVLIDLAGFIGLQCSEEQAAAVRKAHQNASPHGDYTTHGLRLDTILWMNATMARLLPEPLAIRWGLEPTDL